MSYIGKQPTKAPLTASDIEDGIITAAKIEDGAVVAAEIASNAVTTAKINADAVTAAKIADNAVVTAGINADAVTGAKIADDAINSEHYTDGSIDTAHLADGQVTTAKLATAVFTGATDIGADIADADLFLLDDGAGGTIRKTAASRIKTYVGGGITNAQQWRISAAQSNMGNGDHVTNNWEQADSFGYGGIGSAMSQSSGIFTFPSTGIWLVQFTYNGSDGSAQNYVGGIITSTTNNSSYGEAVIGRSSIEANGYFTGTINFIFDVTSTSTHKVRFAVHCETGQIVLSGDSNRTDTGAVFIRLGDT